MLFSKGIGLGVHTLFKRPKGRGMYPSPRIRLPEADFLKAPPILREEAIFTGADLLAAHGSKKMILKQLKGQVPRRSVVRSAVRPGAASRLDLGPVRLKKQNGFLVMEAAGQFSGERGFSLLIKETGFYTLRGKVLGLGKDLEFCIRVGASSGRESLSPSAFYAGFPLVFRNYRKGDRIYRGGHKRRFQDILEREACSEYAGIIVAEDTVGPAAFIGLSKSGKFIVISREGSGAGASAFNEVSMETRFSGNSISWKHVSLER